MIEWNLFFPHFYIFMIYCTNDDNIFGILILSQNPFLLQSITFSTYN